MADISDPLEKARLRQLKRDKAREEADQRAKDNAARIRKLERQYATRQAMLIGSTILDAALSVEEARVLAGILNRRRDKPSDWYKLDRLTKVNGADPALLGTEPLDFAAAKAESLDRVPDAAE